MPNILLCTYKDFATVKEKKKLSCQFYENWKKNKILNMKKKNKEKYG